MAANVEADRVKISCRSRSGVEKANKGVHPQSFAHCDLGDRLCRRFAEIYDSAIHQNVSFDDKTWSEAAEDGNTSIETDPVNVDRKVQLDERILRLDNLIVEISNKRKVTPAQLSLQLAKLLKLKRKASALYLQQMESKATKIHRLPTSEQTRKKYSERLEGSCVALNSTSKSLPVTEDKMCRIDAAFQQSSEMVHSRTNRVIQKPLKDETVLASSVTPLKRRLQEDATPETNIPDDGASSRKIRCEHPITRYHLKSQKSEKNAL